MPTGLAGGNSAAAPHAAADSERILKIAAGWTTQAIGQQHTSPLRARCEARRREVLVICGCSNGLARDAPKASKVDGGLRAGGPQGL